MNKPPLSALRRLSDSPVQDARIGQRLVTSRGAVLLLAPGIRRLLRNIPDEEMEASWDYVCRLGPPRNGLPLGRRALQRPAAAAC